MKRSDLAKAIDRVRDQLLIARDAIGEDAFEKAEEAIAAATVELRALVERLRG